MAGELRHLGMNLKDFASLIRKVKPGWEEWGAGRWQRVYVFRLLP